MKIYQTNEIKNLAIVGNAGAGKTTLAEAMLFEGGLVKRKGNINATTRYVIISRRARVWIFRLFNGVSH